MLSARLLPVLLPKFWRSPAGFFWVMLGGADQVADLAEYMTSQQAQGGGSQAGGLLDRSKPWCLTVE
jgi:hypothetical protein